MATHTLTDCPCCSLTNLQKVDPTTGAIIWKKKVPGNGTVSGPRIYGVRPLRGTTDILCFVEAFDVSLGAPYETLCRVDDTGSQVWSIENFTPGNDLFDVGGAASMNVDSDGTNICYNGSVSWNYSGVNNFTFIGSGGAHLQSPVCGLSPFGLISSVVTSGVLTPKLQTVDAATGAVIVAGTTNYLSSRAPVAVDQSTGNFLLSDGAAPKLISSATQIVLSTFSGFSVGVGRWSDGGIAFISVPGANVVYGVRDPGSLAAVWSNTVAPTIAPTSTDRDATGSYFGGIKQTGGYAVYKYDDTGAFKWGNCLFGSGGAGSCNGVAVADDGYVYAGGDFG